MPRSYTRKIEIRELPREIPILLRLAQPTYSEIEGETNVRERRKRERERDSAINQLIKLYRDAGKRGKLEQFDFRARMFCENLKGRSGGRLPKVRGGRPIEEHRRLLIAVRIQEAIEILGKDKRGSVARALRAVARLVGKHNVSYEAVRKIYEDRDPEWLPAIKTELAARRRNIHCDPDPEWQRTIAELTSQSNRPWAPGDRGAASKR